MKAGKRSARIKELMGRELLSKNEILELCRIVNTKLSRDFIKFIKLKYPEKEIRTDHKRTAELLRRFADGKDSNEQRQADTHKRRTISR